MSDIIANINQTDDGNTPQSTGCPPHADCPPGQIWIDYPVCQCQDAFARWGCTDRSANNYREDANRDDGSCIWCYSSAFLSGGEEDTFACSALNSLHCNESWNTCYWEEEQEGEIAGYCQSHHGASWTCPQIVLSEEMESNYGVTRCEQVYDQCITNNNVFYRKPGQCEIDISEGSNIISLPFTGMMGGCIPMIGQEERSVPLCPGRCLQIPNCAGTRYPELFANDSLLSITNLNTGEITGRAPSSDDWSGNLSCICPENVYDFQFTEGSNFTFEIQNDVYNQDGFTVNQNAVTNYVPYHYLINPTGYGVACDTYNVEVQPCQYLDNLDWLQQMEPFTNTLDWYVPYVLDDSSPYQCEGNSVRYLLNSIQGDEHFISHDPDHTGQIMNCGFIFGDLSWPVDYNQIAEEGRYLKNCGGYDVSLSDTFYQISLNNKFYWDYRIQLQKLNTEFINSGCTDERACNYDPTAVYDDNSCIFNTKRCCRDTTGNGFCDMPAVVEQHCVRNCSEVEGRNTWVDENTSRPLNDISNNECGYSRNFNTAFGSGNWTANVVDIEDCGGNSPIPELTKALKVDVTNWDGEDGSAGRGYGGLHIVSDQFLYSGNHYFSAWVKVYSGKFVIGHEQHMMESGTTYDEDPDALNIATQGPTNNQWKYVHNLGNEHATTDLELSNQPALLLWADARNESRTASFCLLEYQYYDTITDISEVDNCCCEYKFDCGGTRIDSTDWTHNQTYPLNGYCDNCAYYDSQCGTCVGGINQYATNNTDNDDNVGCGCFLGSPPIWYDDYDCDGRGCTDGDDTGGVIEYGTDGFNNTDDVGYGVSWDYCLPIQGGETPVSGYISTDIDTPGTNDFSGQDFSVDVYRDGWMQSCTDDSECINIGTGQCVNFDQGGGQCGHPGWLGTEASADCPCYFNHYDCAGNCADPNTIDESTDNGFDDCNVCFGDSVKGIVGDDYWTVPNCDQDGDDLTGDVCNCNFNTENWNVVNNQDAVYDPVTGMLVSGNTYTVTWTGDYNNSLLDAECNCPITYCDTWSNLTPYDLSGNCTPAYLDECGDVVGGATGLQPEYSKDSCGVCYGSTKIFESDAQAPDPATFPEGVIWRGIEYQGTSPNGYWCNHDSRYKNAGNVCTDDTECNYVQVNDQIYRNLCSEYADENGDRHCVYNPWGNGDPDSTAGCDCYCNTDHRKIDNCGECGGYDFACTGCTNECAIGCEKTGCHIEYPGYWPYADVRVLCNTDADWIDPGDGTCYLYCGCGSGCSDTNCYYPWNNPSGNVDCDYCLDFLNQKVECLNSPDGCDVDPPDQNLFWDPPVGTCEGFYSLVFDLPCEYDQCCEFVNQCDPQWGDSYPSTCSPTKPYAYQVADPSSVKGINTTTGSSLPVFRENKYYGPALTFTHIDDVSSDPLWGTDKWEKCISWTNNCNSSPSEDYGYSWGATSGGDCCSRISCGAIPILGTSQLYKCKPNSGMDWTSGGCYLWRAPGSMIDCNGEQHYNYYDSPNCGGAPGCESAIDEELNQSTAPWGCFAGGGGHCMSGINDWPSWLPMTYSGGFVAVRMNHLPDDYDPCAHGYHFPMCDVDRNDYYQSEQTGDWVPGIWSEARYRFGLGDARMPSNGDACQGDQTLMDCVNGCNTLSNEQFCDDFISCLDWGGLDALQPAANWGNECVGGGAGCGDAYCCQEYSGCYCPAYWCSPGNTNIFQPTHRNAALSTPLGSTFRNGSYPVNIQYIGNEDMPETQLTHAFFEKNLFDDGSEGSYGVTQTGFQYNIMPRTEVVPPYNLLNPITNYCQPENLLYCAENPPWLIYGCTDSGAWNFDENAVEDDGSCFYPQSNQPNQCYSLEMQDGDDPDHINNCHTYYSHFEYIADLTQPGWDGDDDGLGASGYIPHIITDHRFSSTPAIDPIEDYCKDCLDQYEGGDLLFFWGDYVKSQNENATFAFMCHDSGADDFNVGSRGLCAAVQPCTQGTWSNGWGWSNVEQDYIGGNNYLCADNGYLSDDGEATRQFYQKLVYLSTDFDPDAPQEMQEALIEACNLCGHAGDGAPYVKHGAWRKENIYLPAYGDNEVGDYTDVTHKWFSVCCGGPVTGCTNTDAINYDPNATVDDGSCQSYFRGCWDPDANNYGCMYFGDGVGEDYTTGSCSYPGGCLTIPNATEEQCIEEPGWCKYEGCMDATADNYMCIEKLNDCCEDGGNCINNAATGECGDTVGCCEQDTRVNTTCTSGALGAGCIDCCIKTGCTDFEAPNYDSNATHDCNGDSPGTYSDGWNSCCDPPLECTSITGMLVKNYEPSMGDSYNCDPNVNGGKDCWMPDDEENVRLVPYFYFCGDGDDPFTRSGAYALAGDWVNWTNSYYIGGAAIAGTGTDWNGTNDPRKVRCGRAPRWWPNSAYNEFGTGAQYEGRDDCGPDENQPCTILHAMEDCMEHAGQRETYWAGGSDNVNLTFWNEWDYPNNSGNAWANYLYDSGPCHNKYEEYCGCYNKVGPNLSSDTDNDTNFLYYGCAGGGQGTGVYHGHHNGTVELGGWNIRPNEKLGTNECLANQQNCPGTGADDWMEWEIFQTAFGNPGWCNYLGGLHEGGHYSSGMYTNVYLAAWDMCNACGQSPTNGFRIKWEKEITEFTGALKCGSQLTRVDHNGEVEEYYSDGPAGPWGYDHFDGCENLDPEMGCGEEFVFSVCCDPDPGGGSIILGCMNENACNYNPDATLDINLPCGDTNGFGCCFTSDLCGGGSDICGCPQEYGGEGCGTIDCSGKCWLPEEGTDAIAYIDDCEVCVCPAGHDDYIADCGYFDDCWGGDSDSGCEASYVNNDGDDNGQSTFDQGCGCGSAAPVLHFQDINCDGVPGDPNEGTYLYLCLDDDLYNSCGDGDIGTGCYCKCTDFCDDCNDFSTCGSNWDDFDSCFGEVDQCGVCNGGVTDCNIVCEEVDPEWPGDGCTGWNEDDCVGNGSYMGCDGTCVDNINDMLVNSCAGGCNNPNYQEDVDGTCCSWSGNSGDCCNGLWAFGMVGFCIPPHLCDGETNCDSCNCFCCEVTTLAGEDDGVDPIVDVPKGSNLHSDIVCKIPQYLVGSDNCGVEGKCIDDNNPILKDNWKKTKSAVKKDSYGSNTSHINLELQTAIEISYYHDGEFECEDKNTGCIYKLFNYYHVGSTSNEWSSNYLSCYEYSDCLPHCEKQCSQISISSTSGFKGIGQNILSCNPNNYYPTSCTVSPTSNKDMCLCDEDTNACYGSCEFGNGDGQVCIDSMGCGDKKSSHCKNVVGKCNGENCNCEISSPMILGKNNTYSQCQYISMEKVGCGKIGDKSYDPDVTIHNESYCYQNSEQLIDNPN